MNEEELRERLALIEKVYSLTEAQHLRYLEESQQGQTFNFSLPLIYKEEPNQPVRPGETRITGYQALERPVGRLRILEKNTVSIAIVGPANSGKSTLAASLGVEIKKQLERIRHFSLSTAGLEVSCVFVDLDRSTPDVKRILDESGLLEREKTPWSNPLAVSAARELRQTDGNIIIADGPGGKPDEITQIVISPSDLTILLVAAESDEDWVAQRGLWREALQKVSSKTVVLLRSRRTGETSPTTEDELNSTLTSFRWAKDEFVGRNEWIGYAGGRIIGLDREVLENDPGISLLAQILVFDLLPLVVIRRMRQALKHLDSLRSEWGFARKHLQKVREKSS